MRTSIFALLIAILPLIYSCEEHLRDPQSVEIKYTLIDSVSPLRVLLHVNKNLFYTEWILNDTIYFGDGGKDSVEMILEKPGINHIDLVATGVDNIHYEGTVTINVPGAANKLKINGFYFKNNIKLPIDRDSVQVVVYHNNDIENPQFVIKYSTSDFLGHDTIIFKDPVVLNVFNCFDIKDAKMSNLYFIVQDTPIYNFEDIPAGYFDGTLSGPIQKCYFASNIDVFEAFRLRLIFPPHQIQMFGRPDPMKEVRLLIDWKL